MQKVLITGGAGFLGSHLVDALADHGYHVTIFDRQQAKWAPSSVRVIVGDLLDLATLSEAVAGQDAVFHLGGFADLNAAKTRPAETVQANIVGTVNVLEAMRTLRVDRLVFASTAYVYSREGGFYRCSKQACESYIEEYARVFGIRYTIVRYGSLYGPRADASNGIYRLLRSAMADGQITYVGAPDDIREYIHVEDAARLSLEVLAPQFEGHHIMLTGASATRAADLFMMFQEILGRKLVVNYLHEEGPGTGHYAVTPYAFTPRPGKKLTTTEYVDMGQGLLRLIEELHNQLAQEL